MFRERLARKLAEFRATRDVSVYREYYGDDWTPENHDEKVAYMHLERHDEKDRYEYEAEDEDKYEYEYEEVFESDDEEEEVVEKAFEQPDSVAESAATDDAGLEEEEAEEDEVYPGEPLRTQAEWHALFHKALAVISTEKVSSASSHHLHRSLII